VSAIEPETAITTATEAEAWCEAALAAPAARPLVRVVGYAAPAIVLGPAQRSDAELEQRAEGAGMALVQRMAGGGAVCAGPFLVGALVVLPPGHGRVIPNLGASYRWFGEALAGWLADLGVPATVPGGRPLPPDPELAWACFAGRSHGEAVVGERKIVGLAQARRRNGTLFGAGILIGPTPWSSFCEIMGKPPAHADELARRTAYLAELVPRLPGIEELTKGVAGALIAALD